jgi:cytochrome c
VGRKSGSVPGFNYSKAMKNANVVWNEESLTAFLSDPQKAVPGNRMPFAGVSDPGDLAQLVKYLKALQ